MTDRNGIPPDAGASYLGAYTLKNEWAIWLLKNDPFLLTLTPAELHRFNFGRPPQCTARRDEWTGKRWRYVRPAEPCKQAMKYRPGFWCCYAHRETVRDRVFVQPKPMRLCDDNDEPVDVLALVGTDTDVEYRDGKWRVIPA